MQRLNASPIAVVVCAVGILKKMAFINQWGADMKTRHEMVYDFMVALAGNSDTFHLQYSDMPDQQSLEAHQAIYLIASKLADEYLKHLG
jgi:hypothetical protein